VIASQAIISGRVFSLTQQSIQLGFLPRMHIRHTTSHAMGQIYVAAGELAAGSPPRSAR